MCYWSALGYITNKIKTPSFDVRNRKEGYKNPPLLDERGAQNTTSGPVFNVASAFHILFARKLLIKA